MLEVFTFNINIIVHSLCEFGVGLSSDGRGVTAAAVKGGCPIRLRIRAKRWREHDGKEARAREVFSVGARGAAQMKVNTPGNKEI